MLTQTNLVIIPVLDDVEAGVLIHLVSRVERSIGTELLDAKVNLKRALAEYSYLLKCLCTLSARVLGRCDHCPNDHSKNQTSNRNKSCNTSERVSLRPRNCSEDDAKDT